MTKRFYKHKLLLDENIPTRQDFPRLNELFDVKHIRDDLHLDGLGDPDVYHLAVKSKRLMVTYNIKHFRVLAAGSLESGVIAVSANLTFQQMDTKLTALLLRSTPNALAGKFTSLTSTTTVVRSHS